MAIIPNNQQFISLSPTVDTTERRSALINAESQAYTMQDITDTTRPYKVYTALLTQSGTNAPVATVLQNTLSGNVNFVRLQAGQYSITSSNLFGNTSPVIVLGSNRTAANIGGTVSTLITRYLNSSNIDFWSMNSNLDSFIEGFGAINNVSIEIRVYL